MKTCKEEEYSVFPDGLSKKDLSEVVKTSYNKISVKRGLVLIHKGRHLVHDDEVLGPIEDTSIPLLSVDFSNSFYLGRALHIAELVDYELKKTCAVYVKVNFDAGATASDLIDFGYEDGTYDGTIIPYIFGLLSKKTYNYNEADGEVVYEVHETEPEDSDDESLVTPRGDFGAVGHTGYFYIKIADIELTNGRFKIKQRHRGPISLSPVQIYFGAYELTQA